MPASARGRGALEREVLAVLAAVGRPLTAAQVRHELARPLAYTTVMTTLSRLHAKHALTRTVSGRAHLYELAGGAEAGAAGARASMTAHRMLRLLDGGEDRVGVLARFVSDLSPEDERLLTDLLGRDDGAP